MSIVSEVLIELPDGRKVWRVTFVRYRDAENGKFISADKVDDPDPKVGPDLDPDSMREQALSTLVEITSDPDLAVKSSSSVRMLLSEAEKLKMEQTELFDDEEWFVLGRALAWEVLDLLEAEEGGIST